MMPVLFTIGRFNAYSFGFFLALSFLLSTFIIWKFGKSELKEEEYLDAYLYTSIFALVSARLVYILFHFDEFGVNILRYIVVRETPGLSLLGGLFGAVAFLFWYTKKYKFDFLHISDLFSVSISLAFVFVKIGQQLGGSGFGKETQNFLGVKIIGLEGIRYPVETYEAILFLLVFSIVLFLYNRYRLGKVNKGTISLVFVYLFSWIIFLGEFLRSVDIYIFGLTFKQILALFGIIALTYPLLKRSKIVKIIRKEKKDELPA